MEISELKDFILWCKANKIKHFSKDGVVFEFSDLAFVEQYIEDPSIKETNLDSKQTLVDNIESDQAENDELLYWSTNK